MNLLADESVDRQVVASLRAHGHRKSYIAESQPGITDEEVLDNAEQEGLPLLTADKDFGELIFRQGRQSTGIILIRLSGLSAETKAHIVVSAVRDYESDLTKAFTVITPGIIRVRHIIQPEPET